MKQQGRHKAATTVLAAVTSLALVAGSWNAAAAGPASTNSAPEATITGPAGGNKPTSPPVAITLITGDRVIYTPLGGGKFTATMQPDPSSGTRRGRVFNDADGVYAIPDQAEPLIVAGALDRELFNVKYLADNGYADAATGQIPVIVRYAGKSAAAPTLSQKTDALPATSGAKGLRSINGASVKVGKASADSFWRTVRGTSADAAARSGSKPALAAGVQRVSLDGKVRVLLDESVPQIGAPEAWAAGYNGAGTKVAVLDTGIDATHPDLTGRVVTAKSFIDDVGPVDDNGHGTHVAATIASTGDGLGGKYTGVAPGTSLVVGKVCDSSGGCPNSSIIAGMEWAVDQNSDVVSMSLGGPPTDGTDDMSLAVNQLSAASDTLFVIAAGNSGPGESTVGTPGSADAALAVAAVDKADQMAYFSSRGPRAGDSALKPDIAAPGVDITAARAAGTALGTPAEDGYTTASGTSMATPHVAGAAAILAQRRPDLDGEQLKAVLMSTSKGLGFTPYEQGAGRVDVMRAVSQLVTASTPSVDFGLRTWPHDSGPVVKTVTYDNAGDAPVTLQLRLSVKNSTGEPSPDGLLSLGADTVTVPAGGSAAVPVTLDETRDVVGLFTGELNATADGIAVRTPLAVNMDSEQFGVRMNLTFPDGSCAQGPGKVVG